MNFIEKGLMKSLISVVELGIKMESNPAINEKKKEFLALCKNFDESKKEKFEQMARELGYIK